MTSAKSLDDIPGPKGVPLLGNMFEIKQATLIQDLMKLGREWGPIFKLTTPTGPRYIVYGLEMSTTSATTPASTSSSG
jgi:cytochrome P450 / NADPH-cytochrome P450 reductase